MSSVIHVESSHTFAINVDDHQTYRVEASGSWVRVYAPHAEKPWSFQRDELVAFAAGLMLVAERLDGLPSLTVPTVLSGDHP